MKNKLIEDIFKHQPSAIYLGYTEFNLIACQCTGYEIQITSYDKQTFMGISVFKVQASSHYGLGLKGV